MVNRRTFNKHLFNTSALGAVSAWGFQPPPMSFRETAVGKNLLVGSAVSFAELQRPDFTRLLAQQANIVVSENDLTTRQVLHNAIKLGLGRE